VGIVPHDFDEWQTDFALWCSYKYLNGGPGATAFLYVNKKHFQLEPALPGWFGYQKDKQFNMALHFEHAQNAGGWQISSPAILSSAPLEGALSIILEAGIQQIREKSAKMTSYLIYLVDELLSKPPYDYSVGTPREPQRRGGHVAIEHSKADTIIQELIRKGIVPDYRPPNIIRTAPASLYTKYHEIWQMIDTLKQAINPVT
jgi:kynureninase